MESLSNIFTKRDKQRKEASPSGLAVDCTPSQINEEDNLLAGEPVDIEAGPVAAEEQGLAVDTTSPQINVENVPPAEAIQPLIIEARRPCTSAVPEEEQGSDGNTITDPDVLLLLKVLAKMAKRKHDSDQSDLAVDSTPSQINEEDNLLAGEPVDIEAGPVAAEEQDLVVDATSPQINLENVPPAEAIQPFIIEAGRPSTSAVPEEEQGLDGNTITDPDVLLLIKTLASMARQKHDWDQSGLAVDSTPSQINEEDNLLAGEPVDIEAGPVAAEEQGLAVDTTSPQINVENVPPAEAIQPLIIEAQRPCTSAVPEEEQGLDGNTITDPDVLLLIKTLASMARQKHDWDQSVQLLEVNDASNSTTREDRKRERGKDRPDQQKCLELVDRFVCNATYHPDEKVRAANCAELLMLFRARKAIPDRIYKRSTNSHIKGVAVCKIIQTVSFHIDNGLGEEYAAQMLSTFMDIFRKGLVHCPLQEREIFCCKFIPIMLKFRLRERQIFTLLHDLFSSSSSELNWTCIEAFLMQLKYYTLSASPIDGPGLHQQNQTTILYPSSNDLGYWLRVMQAVNIRLLTLIKDDDVLIKACQWLPVMFRALLELQKINEDNHLDFDATVSHTYQSLLEGLVAKLCQSEELTRRFAPQLNECFRVVATAFEADRWRAQHIVAIMFKIAGRNCADVLMGIVKSFKEIEKNLGSHRIEHAVAAAIRVFGPEVVLQELSLKTEDGRLNMARLYLIPLLKANIRPAASSIGYFFEEIWPLAIDCQRRSKDETPSEANDHQYNMLDLAHQLLELLPAFCEAATDIDTHFKRIAAIVYSFITVQKLRSPALMALHNCLLNAKIAKNQQHLDAVKQYDKMLFSVLCDYWCLTGNGDDESDKMMALACLKLLVSISKQTLLTNRTVFRAVTNLNVVDVDDDSNGKSALVKRRILQFFIEILPWLNWQQICFVYAKYLRYLPEIRDKAEQAEAYRLLKRMCGNAKNGGCKTFMTISRTRICSLLWHLCLMVETEGRFHYRNKRERFRILAYMMRARVKSRPNMIRMEMTVSEAIDFLQTGYRTENGPFEVSEDSDGESTSTAKERQVRKLRAKADMNLAYDVLVWAFERCQLFGKMDDFLLLVTRDLDAGRAAATAENMPAVVLALACILRKFSDKLGPDHVERMTNIVITKAMGVNMTPMVQTAAIEYIKVFFVKLPVIFEVSDSQWRQFEMIFGQLAAMPDDIKDFTMKQLQMAFEVLPSKCSYELVSWMVPPFDLKLSHIVWTAYSYMWRSMWREYELKDEKYFRDRVFESFKFHPGITRLEAILTDLFEEDTNGM